MWQVSPIKVVESGDASEGSQLLPLGGGNPDLEQLQVQEEPSPAGRMQPEQGDGRMSSPGLMLEMLCELLAAGSWAGRKEPQRGRGGWEK